MYRSGIRDLMDFFDLPREVQRRILVVLSAGFFADPRESLGKLLKSARVVYELGQQYFMPEVYLLGPPKTGTTWLYECMAGTGYEWSTRGERGVCHL